MVRIPAMHWLCLALSILTQASSTPLVTPKLANVAIHLMVSMFVCCIAQEVETRDDVPVIHAPIWEIKPPVGIMLSLCGDHSILVIHLGMFRDHNAHAGLTSNLRTDKVNADRFKLTRIAPSI